MEYAFTAASDLLPVKALKQHWTQNEFSYREYPRPDHGLMLLTNGQIDFIAPDTMLRATVGDVIFLPRGCRYIARFRTDLGGIDNYLINFNSEMLRCDASRPQRLLQQAPSHCAMQFRDFVEENHREHISILRSKGLFLLLLNSIFQATNSQSTPHSALIERAKWLLQNNALSIRDIARQCSVSESGLRALFHTHTGMSPSQFRLQNRLSRAAYLLESTDMTVNEIADALHFYDSACFCRAFRRYSGQTPRQFSRSKKL